MDQNVVVLSPWAPRSGSVLMESAKPGSPDTWFGSGSLSSAAVVRYKALLAG